MTTSPLHLPAPIGPLGRDRVPLPEVLLDLVLPRSCAGCGEPGCGLCPACRAVLAGPALGRLPPAGPGQPPIAAFGAYGGVLRGVLLAHKEQGRLALARPLGAALARAAVALDPPADTVVVPVPSARDAVRTRGQDHARRLAGAAARRLGLRCRPLLRPVRATADQAGLAAADRAANLHEAFAARRPLTGVGALVVDDVTTTGATAREAVRALEAAGATVRGVAVVAMTRRAW